MVIVVPHGVIVVVLVKVLGSECSLSETLEITYCGYDHV